MASDLTGTIESRGTIQPAYYWEPPTVHIRGWIGSERRWNVFLMGSAWRRLWVSRESRAVEAQRHGIRVAGAGRLTGQSVKQNLVKRGGTLISEILHVFLFMVDTGGPRH